MYKLVRRGEKPFECDAKGCGKFFSTVGNLRTHQLIHSNTRPHKCPFPTCESDFRQAINLKAHMRTHTGERPFRCLHANCGKLFTALSSVRRHVRHYHVADGSIPAGSYIDMTKGASGVPSGSGRVSRKSGATRQQKSSSSSEDSEEHFSEDDEHDHDEEDEGEEEEEEEEMRARKINTTKATQPSLSAFQPPQTTAFLDCLASVASTTPTNGSPTSSSPFPPSMMLLAPPVFWKPASVPYPSAQQQQVAQIPAAWLNMVAPSWMHLQQQQPFQPQMPVNVYATTTTKTAASPPSPSSPSSPSQTQRISVSALLN